MLGLLKKQFSSSRKNIDEDIVRIDLNEENNYENLKNKFVAGCQEKGIPDESYKKVIIEIDKRIKNRDGKYKLDLANCNLSDDVFGILVNVLRIEPYLLLKLTISNNKLLTNASLNNLLDMIKSQVKTYNSKKISDQLSSNYLVDVTLPSGCDNSIRQDITFYLPILEHANYNIKLFKLITTIMKKRNLNGFLNEDTISALWIDQFGSNAWARYPVSIAKSNNITFTDIKNAVVDEMVHLGKLPCLNVDQINAISQVDVVNNQTVYNSNSVKVTDDKNVVTSKSRSSSPNKGASRATSPKKKNVYNPEIDNIINEIIFIDTANKKSHSRPTSPAVRHASPSNTRNASRNASPSHKQTVSPSNAAHVDMKSYILNNFSKTATVDHVVTATTSGSVDDNKSPEVNTSEIGVKTVSAVPSQDQVSDAATMNPDLLADSPSPSKKAVAVSNEADLAAVPSIDVSPISKSNVTFSSDVPSSPDGDNIGKLMSLSPYTSTPQSLADSLINIEKDIFTHLKQEHMKALFGSDSPERKDPVTDSNNNSFQFVGKSLIASHLDLSGNNLESFNATTFPFPQSSLSQILVLDLSHNSLNSSGNLDFCVLCSLIDLNLRSNMLTGTLYCDRIFPASLKRLDISHNQISGIEGLGSVNMISLNASYNSITTITLLPSTLKQLYLQNNNIDDPFTFHMFGMCPKLTDIGLEANPLVSKYSDWRIRLISFLPHIIKIDGEVRNLSLLKMKATSVSSQQYTNTSMSFTKSPQKSPPKSPYKSPKRMTKSQQLEADEKRRRYSDYQSHMLEQKKKELENYYDKRLKSTLYDKCTSLRGGKPLSPTKLIQLLSRLEHASIRGSVSIDLSPNKGKARSNSAEKKTPKKK